MGDLPDDIKIFRDWRDEHADERLRHRAMPSGEAFLWGGIDLLLKELDRRIDPDDLDEDQLAIYEKGYVAGQRMCANRLRQLAREFEL